MHVIVTFHLDADDLKHNTGVSNKTFVSVSAAVSNAGGYDLDFELVEDGDDD